MTYFHSRDQTVLNANAIIDEISKQYSYYFSEILSQINIFELRSRMQRHSIGGNYTITTNGQIIEVIMIDPH